MQKPVFDDNGRALTTITNFVGDAGVPSTPTKAAVAPSTPTSSGRLPPTTPTGKGGARRPSVGAAAGASPRGLAVARKEAKNVRVYLRVRPPNDSEDGTAVTCSPEDPGTITLRGSRHYYADPHSDSLAELEANGPPQERSYSFEQVFGPRTTQLEIYSVVAKQTVQDVFDGYHGLLFAYGQTGSGKTFTLCNRRAGEEGIIVQAVKEVFQTIAQTPDYAFDCSMQMVQLYQEQFQDLLSPEMPMVQLHDDPELEGGVFLDGGSNRSVQTAEQCLALYRMADERRTTANTMMNEKSSRSHTVFVLNVHKKHRGEGADQSELRGRLIIVDLAGSERNRKTGATGIRLNEAKAINTSLLLLGRVVDALTDPSAQHVPFRDSKLTRFLQYALAGNGKTSIVITVSPSSTQFEETHGAIMFGQRARKVKHNAKVHTTVDYKALAMKLQQMLAAQTEALRAQLTGDWKAEIAAKDERIAELEELVARLQREALQKDEAIAALQLRVDELLGQVAGLEHRQELTNALSAQKDAQNAALQQRVTELEQLIDTCQRERDESIAELQRRADELAGQVLVLQQRPPPPTSHVAVQVDAVTEREAHLDAALVQLRQRCGEKDEVNRSLLEQNERLVTQVRQLEEALVAAQPPPSSALSVQTGATLQALNGPSSMELELQALLRAATNENESLREQLRNAEQSNEYLIDELEALQAGDYHHSGCKDKAKKTRLFIHRDFGKKKKTEEYVAKAPNSKRDFISSHNHLKCNQYALVHQADQAAEVWKGVVSKSRTGNGVNVIFDTPEALLASLPPPAEPVQTAVPAVAALVTPRMAAPAAAARSRSYNPYGPTDSTTPQ